MTLVTLTDHNTIDGVLEILAKGLPDVFISSEITTTFPEDGCNVHINVLNMTEAQFQEVMHLRRNIYEMVAYIRHEIAAASQDLDKNQLAYFITHPLMSTQNRPYGREGALSLAHIEKAILLCHCFEVRNGTRTRHLNETTTNLITSLTPEIIERLANKHNITPWGDTPWMKAIVGGSDDHSGLNAGETFTCFPTHGKPLVNISPNDLIHAIRYRETSPDGAHGGPITLAHAIVKLMHDHQFETQYKTDVKTIQMEGPLNTLLQYAFDSGSMSLIKKINFKLHSLEKKLLARFTLFFDNDQKFESILSQLALELISNKTFQKEIAEMQKTDDKIFMIISRLLNRIFLIYIDRIQRSNSYGFIKTIKEIVALLSSNLFVSLPYLVSYFQQTSDSILVRDVQNAFNFDEPEKLLLVTDTYFEINGVANTVKKIIQESKRRRIDFTVVTCLDGAENEQLSKGSNTQQLLEEGRLKIFTSIKNLDFLEYDDLQIRFMPLLEFIKYVQEAGFTKMHISTPGTLGLAGLLTAKILQLPTAATYHTSFPEYVENYTQDKSLEALTWRYMIMFYHAFDEVIVPSRCIAELLHQRGLRNRKLLLLDRWVDLQHNRQPGFWQNYGLADEDKKIKYIYVGRVSVEKDLQTLAEAYKKLCQTNSQAHLIIVGDGPYLNEIKQQLDGFPVIYTGFLKGQKLAQAYASADVKVFPSTTDTWGYSPLEAQASGLPVIVSDKGGPQELIEEGVTGYRVRGKDVESLYEAMMKLMDDRARKTMGQNARKFIEENHIEEPFSAILSTEQYRQRIKQKRKSKKHLQTQQHALNTCPL
jgi:glycosyltransferase involved in cell wall biosynthesis